MHPAWRLAVHDSLVSTNDYCIARAEAGEAAGLAVLARRQTGARGSRGRGWSEPPSGNLALSVLLRPSPSFDQPGLWPFLAGLALHDALGAVSAAALTLKWPNDVLLDGRKLAGILIERGVAAETVWLVIGFGANLAQAPLLPDRVAACLAEAGPAPDAEQTARALLAALDRWQALWGCAGFAAIRDAWLRRAHPVGTALAIRDRGAQKEGLFAGIATDGALLLSHSGVTERIETGDVLLRTGSG